jgi:Holliday junction resolvasome RuvABC DNA-binding subunit
MRVLFINYKQSIFRQNTNQSNDSTFTRQVSRKTPTHVIIDCGGIGISCEHLLTYLFFASKWRFYKIVHSPSNKEDAHTLFGFIEKSEREILNCYFQFQVLELT